MSELTLEGRKIKDLKDPESPDGGLKYNPSGRKALKMKKNNLDDLTMEQQIVELNLDLSSVVLTALQGDEKGEYRSLLSLLDKLLKKRSLKLKEKEKNNLKEKVELIMDQLFDLKIKTSSETAIQEINDLLDIAEKISISLY